MTDKSFQKDSSATEKPRLDRHGDPIPEDPSYEEMEEILGEIEYFNELTETLLRLEIQPFRF